MGVGEYYLKYESTDECEHYFSLFYADSIIHMIPCH